MLKSIPPYSALLGSFLLICLCSACNLFNLNNPVSPGNPYIATPDTVLKSLAEAQEIQQPYKYDRLGGVIRPNQLILWFDPEATEVDRDSIFRNRHAKKKLRTCPCEENLVLVDVGNEDPVDIMNSSGGSSNGSKVSGQGLNNITHLLDQKIICQEPKSLPDAPAARKKGVIVAILDTGIDWTQKDCNNLDTRLWFNPDEIPTNNTDEGVNGLVDDMIGYDFVDMDNMPFDLQGHGTHVAGIISNTFQKGVVNGTKEEQDGLRIMAYRVLDEQGSGDIFDCACAALCAAENGAKVINMSFGWYGEESAIFGIALDIIERKHPGVVVVAAAGNHERDMLYADRRIYPAGYASPIVTGVGASMNTTASLTVFSNYFHWFSDIAAPGDNIESCLPCGQKGSLSGTSMAAPFVSAEFALAYLSGASTADVYDKVLNQCLTRDLDDYKIKEGKRTDDSQLNCVR